MQVETKLSCVCREGHEASVEWFMTSMRREDCNNIIEDKRMFGCGSSGLSLKFNRLGPRSSEREDWVDRNIWHMDSVDVADVHHVELEWSEAS